MSFDQLCVVLVRTRNPLNLGAAARAMSNFGIAHLRIVNPHQLAFREARSAVGASHVLKHAEEFSSVAEAVADCSLVVGTTAGRRRELQHPLRRLELTAGPIRKQLQSGRVALLFGSEKTGLSNQDFSHCHWLLHIPTRRESISMNLGQAVAVSLYEVTRDARARAAVQKPAPATGGDLERITSMLLDVLVMSGYAKERRSPDTEEKTRRLVRRLHLSAQDAAILLGILRQLAWKLEHQP